MRTWLPELNCERGPKARTGAISGDLSNDFRYMSLVHGFEMPTIGGVAPTRRLKQALLVD